MRRATHVAVTLTIKPKGGNEGSSFDYIFPPPSLPHASPHHGPHILSDVYAGICDLSDVVDSQVKKKKNGAMQMCDELFRRKKVRKFDENVQCMT